MLTAAQRVVVGIVLGGHSVAITGNLILKIPESSRYFSRDALVLFPLPEVNNDGRFLQDAEDVKKLHISSSFS